MNQSGQLRNGQVYPYSVVTDGMTDADTDSVTADGWPQGWSE